MKKSLALILVVLSVLSLAACGKKAEEEVSTTPTENEQVTEDKKDETQTENIEDEKESEKEEDKKQENEKEEDKTTSSQTKPQTKPEVKPETKPEAKPESKPESTPAPAPETKPEAKPEASKTVGSALLADFKSRAASANALSIAEGLLTNSVIAFSGAAMSVEPGYLNGFDGEIKGFKEGAVFSPMIGTIPFVGYVFTLEDGADTSAFISTLKSSANLRWNICTEAEEMVTGSVGNKVFFVMCPKSFEE